MNDLTHSYLYIYIYIDSIDMYKKVLPWFEDNPFIAHTACPNWAEDFDVAAATVFISVRAWHVDIVIGNSLKRD